MCQRLLSFASPGCSVAAETSSREAKGRKAQVLLFLLAPYYNIKTMSVFEIRGVWNGITIETGKV